MGDHPRAPRWVIRRPLAAQPRASLVFRTMYLRVMHLGTLVLPDRESVSAECLLAAVSNTVLVT